MNLKLELQQINYSGIFSQLMMILPCILEKNSKGPGITNVRSLYLESSAEKQTYSIDNPWDWVFVQDKNYDKHVMCANHGTYAHTTKLGEIEDSDELSALHDITKLLKIKPNILSAVDQFASEHINENTLAVHARLGDMNLCHPEYGVFGIEDYINKIKLVMSNNPMLSNVFIASHTEKYINMIRESLPDIKITSYNCQLRDDLYKFDTGQLQAHNLASNGLLWEEAFIEMLLLSKCTELICRTSNVVNASLIFTDTIKTVHRL